MKPVWWLALNTKEVDSIGLFNVLIASLIVLPTGDVVLPKPEPKSPPPKVEAVKPVTKPTETYTLTAYTADCSGCIGITKTGYDVSETIYHAGNRVIAVDPVKIPLGSTVAIEFDDGSSLVADAIDIGGGINGNEIDLLVGDYGKAVDIGRQSVKVEIINEGKR